jgi:hypothetical protein
VLSIAPPTRSLACYRGELPTSRMRRETGGRRTACPLMTVVRAAPPYLAVPPSSAGNGFAAARGRDRLAFSGPLAQRRAYCAENTAMHPCTQVLPDESM